MNRALKYTFIFFLLPVLLSSTGSFRETASTNTKQYFTEGIQNFKADISSLREMIHNSPEKLVQAQFKKTRDSYKRVEVIMEYFYPFFAARFNGPPIPFFEEGEPDKLQQAPEGLQLIEAEIFPMFSKKNIQLADQQASEILKYIEELSSIQTSFEMTDDNLFDALMEE